jgi:ribA/ribD-fused uncharacterized protein
MNSQADAPIFFWGTGQQWGQFSNFWECHTVIDGKEWMTIEHYFQAQKVLDTQEQEYIRLASTPKRAKDLGRTCVLRKDWEKVKYQVMLNGLRAKFSQPQFKKILLSTGDRPLYEASPYDREWGTGQANGVGTGKNLLGKALMEVRKELNSVAS